MNSFGNFIHFLTMMKYWNSYKKGHAGLAGTFVQKGTVMDLK